MTIGIFLSPVLDDKKYLKMSMELYQYLKDKNINVIGITSVSSLPFCDGVILPGGDNYLKEELEVIKFLYDYDIPTLGICMGMQLMGIFKDGKMEVLKNKNHQSSKKNVHQIQIDKKSKLYQILNQETIVVNSRHNEALISTSLKKSAYSNDGVIEAVEDPDKKFFIGVQWHPESLKDELNNKLLNYFLLCAKK